MSAFWNQFLTDLAATSPLEIVAVVLAIGFLLLAAWENIWCWLCALISTGIYIYLYHDVALISEAILNVFYVVMAIYGCYQWLRGGPKHTVLKISRWSLKRHLVLVVIGLVSFPVLGYLTGTYLGAEHPYLDALTTCFAVMATFMQARKVLENWVYWIVIDAISVYLFATRGLALTSVLFFAYTIGSVFALWRWQRQFSQDHQNQTATAA